jgi:hypothetical protein
MPIRSKLGGHFAGTGITVPADMKDDYLEERSIKINRPGMLPTDYLGDGKEAKKKFEDYCREQSGDVTTYNLKDSHEKKEE